MEWLGFVWCALLLKAVSTDPGAEWLSSVSQAQWGLGPEDTERHGVAVKECLKRRPADVSSPFRALGALTLDESPPPAVETIVNRQTARGGQGDFLEGCYQIEPFDDVDFAEGMVSFRMNCAVGPDGGPPTLDFPFRGPSLAGAPFTASLKLNWDPSCQEFAEPDYPWEIVLGSDHTFPPSTVILSPLSGAP